MKRIIAITASILAAAALAADEFVESDAALPGWSLDAGVKAIMPGGGSSLEAAPAVAVRASRYLTEAFALEMEGYSAPAADCRHGNAAVAGAAVNGRWHLAGWETFDKLFGCERFDPFVTLGAGAIFADRHVFADSSHRTAIGPVFGLGAFYHLTDSLSLRADGGVMLDCATPAGVIFSVGLGLQYSFGGDE